MVIGERERARRVTNSSRLRRGIAVCIRRLICIHRFERLISRLLTLSGLSVCQECRPTCRASPSAIDHPSLSIRSAPSVRYRSFADIDRESRFQPVFHIRASPIDQGTWTRLPLDRRREWSRKGTSGTIEISCRFESLRYGGNFAIFLVYQHFVRIIPRRPNNRLKPPGCSAITTFLILDLRLKYKRLYRKINRRKSNSDESF